MADVPAWNLSHESRARLAELLQSASDLGLDPDAIAAGGLAAIQALLALRQAREAGEGPTRQSHLARAQESLRALDPAVHGDLLHQFQVRALAMEGRGGDTEIAHVSLGEIVLPKALQTPAVIGALRTAAADAGISLDRLRIGSAMNRVNPETGVAEFAEAEATNEEIQGITIQSTRPSAEQREADAKLLARLIYGEAAGQSEQEGLYDHIGWSVMNRIGAPSFPKTLEGVIYQPGQYDAVGDKLWNHLDQPDQMNTLDKRAYAKAEETARGILDGRVPDPLDGAQYFYHGDPDPWFAERQASGRLVPLQTRFKGVTFLRDVQLGR